MLNRDHLSLRLIQLGPGEEWSFNEGENLCLIFPTGGDGSCGGSGATQSLLPGDIAVLKSAFERSASVRGQGGMTFQCFSARFEHLFPLFDASEIGHAHAVLDGFKAIKHYPASHPLAVKCHQLLGEVSPRFSLEHRGQLLRILSTLLSVEFTEERARLWGGMRPQEHITRLFEELSVAEITDCSVLDLAKRFSCSPRHLNRIFNEYFGMSFSAMRMELRLIRAAFLLRDPGVKVVSVAEQCGFNHLGLFNSCFRRRFGSSPGQYRKNLFEEGAAPDQPPTVDKSCRLQAIGLCPRSGLIGAANGEAEKRSAAGRSASGDPKSRPSPRSGRTLRSDDAQRPQEEKPMLQIRIQV